MRVMNGPGAYDPRKDGKHQRDMDRFMSGLKAMLQDSYTAEHKQSKKQERETGYYPAPQAEVRHLLAGLESGDINFKDAVKRGKGRRGRQQAAAMVAQLLLPAFLKGKIMQTEAERATGNRPSFFDALRMRNQ